jgi:hypothetical protein
METKEKKLLKLSYRGSCVKTLEGIGAMVFIIGGISVFIGFIMLLLTDDSGDRVIAVYLLASFPPLLILGVICSGLSSIAKTALYQRIIMESEYEFWDIEKKGEIPEDKPESGNKEENQKRDADTK